MPAAVALLMGIPSVVFAQAADPLINEFVANHTGGDVNEFVELFGDPATDYAAFTILEVEGDDGGSLGVIDGVFPAGTTDAGGFWTTGLLGSQIENGTVTLLLVDSFTGAAGDDLDADDDGVLDPHPPWQRLVDAVAVTDGGSGDLTYTAVTLAPGFDGDAMTPGGASRLPNGVDTDTVADWLRNDFDGDGLPAFPDAPPAASGEAVNTPGTENQEGFTPPPPPPPPGLLLNEVDADTPGADTREFIELYDGGGGHTPLDDLVVVLYNGSNDQSYRAFDLDGLRTDADGFFVLGNSEVVPTPGLIFPPSTLQNGADAVALYAGDEDDFPNGTPVTTAFLVDALVYATRDDDDPGLLTLLNAGQPQVDEDRDSDKDRVSLQRLPNGTGGARNTATYAPFAPTPGSVNGGADLALEKRLTARVQRGAATTATFHLTLANDGPAHATGVEVTDRLPAGMTFVAADAEQGVYDPVTGRWTVGDLARRDVAVLRLTVTADADAVLLNIAEVTAAQEPDPDSTPGDGVGDDVGAAALGRRPPDGVRFRADLRLAQTTSTATARVGETVTFTLTVANDGPAATAGVEVTNRLPGGLAYVSDTGAGRYDPARGLWTVGKLGNGASATLALTATVTGHGALTNTAEVTASHLPDPDSQAANGNPAEDDWAAATVDAQTIPPRITDIEPTIPTALVLGPNYPNPFNAETTLPFDLPEPARVTLIVYDVLGRPAATLVDGPTAAGRHVVRWNASLHPGGVYLARLHTTGAMTKGETRVRYLTLVK